MKKGKLASSLNISIFAYAAIIFNRREKGVNNRTGKRIKQKKQRLTNIELVCQID